MACKNCGSYAINHHCHGRDGSEPKLCDVCFWRSIAERNHTHIKILMDAGDDCAGLLDTIRPNSSTVANWEKAKGVPSKPELKVGDYAWETQGDAFDSKVLVRVTKIHKSGGCHVTDVDTKVDWRRDSHISKLRPIQ